MSLHLFFREMSTMILQLCGMQETVSCMLPPAQVCLLLCLVWFSVSYMYMYMYKVNQGVNRIRGFVSTGVTQVVFTSLHCKEVWCCYGQYLVLWIKGSNSNIGRLFVLHSHGLNTLDYSTVLLLPLATNHLMEIRWVPGMLRIFICGGLWAQFL